VWAGGAETLSPCRFEFENAWRFISMTSLCLHNVMIKHRGKIYLNIPHAPSDISVLLIYAYMGQLMNFDSLKTYADQ
jgi:hypothetical protein